MNLPPPDPALSPWLWKDKDAVELWCVHILKRATEAEADKSLYENRLADVATEREALEAELAALKVHHWSCAPDDPRRRRHILKALLDAIEDAHDEVLR